MIEKDYKQTMDCREFSSNTKNFIFDTIDDKNIIKAYVEHARNCSECYDELKVIYCMHRSLGDIMGPDGKDDSSDYPGELEEILEYYTANAQTDRSKMLLKVMTIVIFVIIVIMALFCLWYIEIN